MYVVECKRLLALFCVVLDGFVVTGKISSHEAIVALDTAQRFLSFERCGLSVSSNRQAATAAQAATLKQQLAAA